MQLNAQRAAQKPGSDVYDERITDKVRVMYSLEDEKMFYPFVSK